MLQEEQSHQIRHLFAILAAPFRQILCKDLCLNFKIYYRKHFGCVKINNFYGKLGHLWYLPGKGRVCHSYLLSRPPVLRGETVKLSIYPTNTSEIVLFIGGMSVPYELCREKTILQGFRPSPTQTWLSSHRRWLEVVLEIGRNFIIDYRFS